MPGPWGIGERWRYGGREIRGSLVHHPKIISVAGHRMIFRLMTVALFWPEEVEHLTYRLCRGCIFIGNGGWRTRNTVRLSTQIAVSVLHTASQAWIK